MKMKYVVVVAIVLSIIILSITIYILWRVPSGVLEVELVKGEYENVTLDSSDYKIGLSLFEEYGERARLRIEASSGYTFRYIDLGETILTFDLKITFKESKANSIIVRIEKIEG